MANYVDSAARYRKAIGQLLAAYEELLGIDTEYVKLDVGNNVVDADFPDITAAQFVAGVGAAEAVMTTINTNGTSLYTASDGSQR